MHLLPHLECEINSDRSQEEIYRILESVTDSRKIMFSTDAEFVGQVHPFDFRIVPKIQWHYHRNSFLPVIRGIVKEEGNGTVIDIKMRMSLLARVFLTVWFGMLCFFALIGILGIIVGGVKESMIFLYAAAMIMFGQLLVRKSFDAPAKRAAKRLGKLLS